MKTRWLILLAPLLILGAVAAMSDAEAVKEASRRWGVQAGTWTIRKGSTASLTRCVGIVQANLAPLYFGCSEGTNWEAAFAAVSPDAIRGPYSGTITLLADAWDDQALAGFQWWLDDQPLGAEIVRDPGQHWWIETPWDTATIPSGIHVLRCSGRDKAGNVGYSKAQAIVIDQSKPSISKQLRLL